MKLQIISQYHPAAALHQPRLWAVMLDDWQNMPERVDSDFTISKSFYMAGNKMLVGFDTEQDGSGGLGQWSIAGRDTQGKIKVLPKYGVDRDFDFLDMAVAAHNWKYDLRVLRDNKMKEPKILHDTMIMAYCLGLGRQAPKDSSKDKSGADMVGGLGLKYLARRHLGMTMNTWQEVHEKPELIPEYNAKDSVATFLLAEKWLPILPKHYFDIDMPLLPVLMKMEDRGIQVDSDFLVKYGKELDNELANIDLPLNPYASQEIQSYIYGVLGFEPWKFTDTGLPSTDADVLEKIDDPLIKDILRYRELFKEKGTYVKGYMKGVDLEGRIHTELKQTSTSTGRLSSANPNLQNVGDPKKGSDTRRLFIASEGMKMIRLDWERMELWALALLANENVMLDALLSGADPHQETADFLSIPRHEGRNVNFLMAFKGGAWKIAMDFGVPISRAKELESGYYKRYPNIKKYHEQQAALANEDRSISNSFGRTRRIDAMFASDWRIKKEGEREAINMPVQGDCAEIVKLAMIDLDKHDAPMILQVHDELLFEVPEKEAEDYAQWLREYVPTITEMKGVQLPVSVEVGNNWGELSE